MAIFEVVTALTSDRKIIEIAGTTSRSGNDVFNGERIWRKFDLAQAILTAMFSTLFDKFSLLLCEAKFRHSRGLQDQD